MGVGEGDHEGWVREGCGESLYGELGDGWGMGGKGGGYRNRVRTVSTWRWGEL